MHLGKGSTRFTATSATHKAGWFHNPALEDLAVNDAAPAFSYPGWRDVMSMLAAHI